MSENTAKYIIYVIPPRSMKVIKQPASSELLKDKWLQSYKKMGWTVKKVVESEND